MKERKQKILKIIVDHYINTGEPIGSKAVVENMKDKLSTATIRNEMAALEEMGYLMQPHISAGRIPSDLAYRFYVDALLEMEPLNKDELVAIKEIFDHQVSDVKQVIGDTVKVLSDITNCVALAMLPKNKEVKVQNIKLVPVTEDKALVIIVTNHGIINDRVVRIPKDMSEVELYAIAQMLTERVGNIKNIEKINKDDFYNELDSHQGFVHEVLDVFNSSLQDENQDIILGGATKIFNFPDCQDIGKAKALIESFEDKSFFADLLDTGEEGISISIGRENEFLPFENCSLITFQYNLEEFGQGGFGIVGPKRMNYGRVLTILNTLNNYINFNDL